MICILTPYQEVSTSLILLSNICSPGLRLQKRIIAAKVYPSQGTVQENVTISFGRDKVCWIKMFCLSSKLNSEYTSSKTAHFMTWINLIIKKQVHSRWATESLVAHIGLTSSQSLIYTYVLPTQTKCQNHQNLLTI